MQRRDRILLFVTRAATILSAAIVVMIAVFLAGEAAPALATIRWDRFVTDSGWHPLSDQFSMWPMMVASLLVSLGALLIAAPIGVGIAVGATCLLPALFRTFLVRIVEISAGIPSVVFGIWGLMAVAPLVARWGGSGQNLLTATLVLSLMILPTVALTAMSALRAVAEDQIQAAAALGLGRLSLIRRILLPAAREGIAVGCGLALCRAVGETMAVLMLAGNVVQLPDSLLAPGRTLTANIALELGYATAEHRSVLFVSGLLLMLLVSLAILLLPRVRGIEHAH